MKKLIIASVALFALSLGSCKKNYDCNCTITRTNGSSSLTTDDGNYTFKDTRVRAEKRCNDQEGSGSDAFGNYTRDCQIK
ncbi:MAG: hypothetical protein HY062_15935 [Bacteroidetes bacterium]|nr:hypothetical protein [Bacteroidota bacterium]